MVILIDWFTKHKDFLRRNGGMEEKKDAIKLKNRVSTRILEQLNQRFTPRPQEPDLPQKV